MAQRPEWKRGWEALRESVLVRDKRLCQPCLRSGRYTEANQVDHIKPRSQGGTNDRSNLEAICSGIGTPECHGEKSKREANAGYTPRAEIGVDGWPLMEAGTP